MNMDFGIEHNKSAQIGLWAERLGFLLFILTFWIPFGFLLGGDGFFLGTFQPTLEVIFPLSGLGIFLVFFGQYFSKREQVLSLSAILFLLGFLGYGALSAIFSLASETSMLFLIVWTTGFLAMGTGEAFFIEGKWKRWTLFVSVLIGFLFATFFPHLGISLLLLAMASLWGMVFALKEPRFIGRIPVLLLYSWIIFSNAQLGLIIFSILLIFGSKLWLPKLTKGNQRRDVWFGLVFLFVLFVWGLFTQHFSLSLSGFWLSSFFSDPLQVLLGVGEGQFLIAFQNSADTVLVPEALRITSSGLLLTLFEKGIIGLLFLVALVFLPQISSEKKPLLPSILTLVFLLLLPDLISTEQGILFFLPFLFAEKLNGRILNFAEGK
jgi:hypothetical protein